MDRINQLQEATKAATQAYSERMQALAKSLPPADIARVLQVRQAGRS